jgi:very-short-patch-repair endonuclease
LEVDGGQHAQQTDYDSTRTEWLKSQGFKLLRLWNNQVLKETESVKLAILNALEAHDSLKDEPDSLSLNGRGPG